MDKELSLRQETVLQILKSNFSDSKTKVNNDALKLMKKYVDILVLETVFRTIDQAKIEQSDAVELQHFEKVLPKLLLDF
ncbi:PREDICTED: centromere protein X-like [Amphimedon queenslandica]|uniref:Centromere protein X n=1 Tax=Amphimedon queenslandica TaxID=400682 RepID=A0A1X7VDV2_AMPQE|nr:PREDICTED: centromere protein X-like [Amphimedon queenslandica]|eukprot:XP_019849221.1 PREDICTED: centromere protein X-like [Amphimedon queenslandica]